MEFESNFNSLESSKKEIEVSLSNLNIDNLKSKLYSFERKTSKFIEFSKEISDFENKKFLFDTILEYTELLTSLRKLNEKKLLIEEFSSKIKTVVISDIDILKGSILLLELKNEDAHKSCTILIGPEGDFQ